MKELICSGTNSYNSGGLVRDPVIAVVVIL